MEASALTVIRSCWTVTTGALAERLMYPAVEWIEVPSEGHVSRARNEGASKARAPWVLFVDEDCHVSPDLVDSITRQITARMLDEHTIWGGVYSRQTTGNVISRAYNWIQRAWVFLSRSEAGEDPHTYNLLGGFLLIHQSVFQRLNGFNEDIPWAGEETDFLRRAQRLGVPTRLLSSVEIQHQKSLTWPGFLRRAWKQGRSRGRYALSTPHLSWWSLFKRRGELDSLTASEGLAVFLFWLVMRLGSTCGRILAG